MKLNLGCGFNREDGYVNVDKEAICRPDVQCDLEVFPWPWADNSVDEVVANHSFEHLGATTDGWLGIIKELWRVTRDGALTKIAVPHPLHENFLHDPTHVRIITPIGLAMFDQQRNIADFEAGGQETKLGLFTGVDFEILEVGYDLADPWRSEFAAGRISRQQLEFELYHQNNICIQIRIMMRTVKPTRGAMWLKDRFGERSPP